MKSRPDGPLRCHCCGELMWEGVMLTDLRICGPCFRVQVAGNRCAHEEK